VCMTARWRRVDLRGDGTNHVEDLEQHGLGDSVVEFTDIERGAGTSSGGLAGGGGRLSLSLVRSLRDRGRGHRGRGSFFDFRHFWLYVWEFRGWARFILLCCCCCFVCSSMGSSTYEEMSDQLRGF